MEKAKLSAAPLHSFCGLVHISDQELLQTMHSMLKEELDPIRSDIAEMKTDIADLKEGQEELRLSINAILGWTDKVSEAVNFPLPKI